MEPFYQHHVFLCVNQKEKGKCCSGNGVAQEMVGYVKEQLKALDLHGAGKIRVSKSGCLGRCKLGPSLLIYPEGTWYRYQSKEDIDLIIKEHLLNQRPVKALLMDSSLPNFASH